MVNIIATGLLSLALVGVASKAFAWRRLLAEAKLTGFPVYLSPVHLTDIWWLILYPVLVPLLEYLPHSWTDPWLALAQLWNIWKLGHKPFAEVGHETIVLSTPQGNLLWTCDPSVIHQLETLHPRSQVAVDMVKFYDVYGPTVGSVEGDEWRQHRRVIMTGFTPATTEAVWTESLKQADLLVQQWSQDAGIVPVVRTWTNRLALHVISAVFFHKSLTWNDRVQGVTPAPVEPAPPGHKMRYDQALTTVLKRLGTLHVTPRALLPYLPFEAVRETHLAYTEWTAYMNELRGETMAKAHEVKDKKYKSILESIVISGTTGSTKSGTTPLPEASILGNIFFTLLAGHETAGNTMAFALLLLAVHPEYQHRIQADIDRSLAARPRTDWTVEHEYRQFQQSWIGAVLTETLRLYCVVQFVPRQIVAPVDIVDSAGEVHTLPTGTLCLMNFAAAFRNPSTWSARRDGVGEEARGTTRAEDARSSPALDFEPERWLGQTAAPRTADGSAPLLFPFGQGPHVCPGQLFALTEMTAVLASILSEHSIELAVSERTLEECGGDVAAATQKTRDLAVRTLVDEVEPNVTVQLTKPLPIRIAKRS